MATPSSKRHVNSPRIVDACDSFPVSRAGRNQVNYWTFGFFPGSSDLDPSRSSGASRTDEVVSRTNGRFGSHLRRGSPCGFFLPLGSNLTASMFNLRGFTLTGKYFLSLNRLISRREYFSLLSMAPLANHHVFSRDSAHFVLATRRR